MRRELRGRVRAARFRRPLSVDEQTRYGKLFDASLTGGDFKTGVGLVIKTMLISPYFLFRSELGQDGGQGNFVLTPYETASALSYTYWGTMPDDALFASAKSGALAKATELEAQARRLLADPRGRSRIASFFYEWLERSPRAYIAAKDMGTYPNLYSGPSGFTGIVDAMRAEEDAFVTHVVFDSTKKFSELFTANYTFANDSLASCTTACRCPEQVTRPLKSRLVRPPARGGLLTLGMFLLGHARTNESSPTQRGHMIRANILCTDIPAPAAERKHGHHAGHTGQDGTRANHGVDQHRRVRHVPQPAGSDRLRPRRFRRRSPKPRTMDNGEAVDTSGQISGSARHDRTDQVQRLEGALHVARDQRHRQEVLGHELLPLRARVRTEGRGRSGLQQIERAIRER